MMTNKEGDGKPLLELWRYEYENTKRHAVKLQLNKDIEQLESALCVLKKKIRERCDVDGVPDETIHANFTSRWKPIKEVFGEVDCYDK